MRARPFLVAATVMAVPALLAGCASLLLSKHPAPDLHVDRSPAAVKRGEYLVKHVAACVGCHSPLTDAHQPVKGREGAGGRRFDKTDGLPGTIYATNLTSDKATGLGSWTDGQIVRAIREGVDKDDNALFPIMPYGNYREMSDADVQAIVAYLRTLPAIRNEVPARQLDFPLGIVVNTIPKPVNGPVPASEPLARGKYVFTIGSCSECHTPRDPHGTPVSGKFCAGGAPFVMTAGHTVPAANITQDKQTGIGGWSDQAIGNAVRKGLRPDGSPLMPVMPWPEYGGLSDEDTKALVTFMRTLPAVANEVKRP